MTIHITLQVLCMVSMGIMGGIYLIFTNTIISALKEVENGALIMAKINDVILNWSFKLIFFFSALSSAYFGIFANNVEFSFQLGCVVFFAGTFLITVFKNIPLNNKLKQAAYMQSNVNETWALYLILWQRWNTIRTFSALLSLILVCSSNYT